jgi:cyclopropane fatty-acyl-phospholipid synthase-like methyltransferase
MIILYVLLVQLLITYYYTNTKLFSFRGFIRNLSIVYSIYYAYTTKKYYVLLYPIILEMILEYLKFKGITIDKYIATKYQYNDYWREINKIDNIFSNFSEANYDKLLGFRTNDLSQKNLNKILKWTIYIYNKSLKEKNYLLTDINGKYHDAIELKKKSDNNKFKLICEKCNINNKMKILEIGFGEGDFMKYIYDNYGIKPIGVSISLEQVKLVQSRGFIAYEMNAWDMTCEKLGTFDLILQCGNLEYIKCATSEDNLYLKYCKIIKSLLNKNGKYFVTCIHFNKLFKYRFYDYLRCYFLWSGNDGYYPNKKNGFSKYAIKCGLVNIYQEDRTIDYWVASVLFMSYFQCRKNNICVNSLNIEGLIKALIKTIAGPYYIHTYLCYTPTKDYNWVPWLWQFIPQKINDKLVFPVTLEYILFENK